MGEHQEPVVRWVWSDGSEDPVTVAERILEVPYGTFDHVRGLSFEEVRAVIAAKVREQDGTQDTVEAQVQRFTDLPLATLIHEDRAETVVCRPLPEGIARRTGLSGPARSGSGSVIW